ncbi:hypothetical protein [Nostoc sp.]|uniref:hypothetical protein n=1 Tax=Nostoc sp. TaxID=1180 RepID=UPI002FF55A21
MLKALRHHTPNFSSENFINYRRLHWYGVWALLWKKNHPATIDVSVYAMRSHI